MDTLGRAHPRVNLGGGGECPLLLVGIEPGRIKGIHLAFEVRAMLNEADDLRAAWRESYSHWRNARPAYEALRREALALMPPGEVEIHR